MDTWQAINSVRVVRRFTDEPVAPEHLDRILNAGRRAGSSKNQQSWAFITIRDREQLRKLAEVGHYADHLAGAAVAIALVRPDARDEHQLRSIMWDLGRAAQNMVLAAWELGIGSVPATVYDLALASRLLGLPADQTLRLPPVVRPSGRPDGPDRAESCRRTRVARGDRPPRRLVAPGDATAPEASPRRCARYPAVLSAAPWHVFGHPSTRTHAWT